MPEFLPSESKVAIVTMSNPTTKPFDYLVELYMGTNLALMTSENFHLEAEETKDISLSVIMPNTPGTYPVYIGVFSGGQSIGLYKAIEDVVITVPVTMVETLRPNAPGDETSIEVVSPPTWAHWQAVSDDRDGYRVYNWGCILRCPYCGNVYMDYATLLYHIHLEHPGLPDPPERTVYKRDLYNLPAPTGFGTINYIKVYIRGRGTSLADEGIRASIKSNGIVTDGDEIDPTAFWAWYSHQWNTNPANGRPWERSDINNLQIGVSLRAQAVAKELRPGGYYCECSQVYVEVNYTPGY